MLGHAPAKMVVEGGASMTASLTERLARYAQLRAYESDFDRAQAEMRRTAGLWILAAFSALAYLLTAAARISSGAEGMEAQAVPFLAATVSWLAILGLFVLWYVDQGVYQRMLNSVFVYGIFLEWHDSRLPQIRKIMYLSNQNISNKLSWYYFMAMAFFTVVSLSAVSVDHWKFGQSAWLGVDTEVREAMMVFMSFVDVSLSAYILSFTYKERDLFSIYGHLFPPEFTDDIRRLAADTR
jgi:hypothetical protein